MAMVKKPHGLPLRAFTTTKPTTAMTHIAIQEALNGKPVDWMEKVSDQQYDK